MPCPTPKIVQLQNGDLLFGSRVVSGLADKTETTAILTSKSVGARRKSYAGPNFGSLGNFTRSTCSQIMVDRHVETIYRSLKMDVANFT